MPARELQRRISRIIPGGNAPGVATWTTYDIAIPSPASDRADSQWRIDGIIVMGGGTTADATAALLYVTPVFPQVAGGGSFANGEGNFALSLSSTLALQTKNDFDMLAAGSPINGVESLDFHPVFVNPRENLRLAIAQHWTGVAGEQFAGGYTLSYTLVSQR